MDKEELLKQLRTAHEKQLWDEEAVSRVLDEYIQYEYYRGLFNGIEMVRKSLTPNQQEEKP